MAGMLIDGKWSNEPINATSSGGRFMRKDSAFRNWVTFDGSPGPTGEGGFKAEPGRYHLYVSHACPWAHRTVIFRALKGLEDKISLSVSHPVNTTQGWGWQDYPGMEPDTVNNTAYLHELYTRSLPDYTGKVTVPVLWDKLSGTIVNNESSEIIRMLNGAFNDVGTTGQDFYPEMLRADIDALNERIYDTVNNGVYRAGFATSQSAYEDAVKAMFETLDWLEERLSTRRYLLGDELTEADWRLFPTLVRFDIVYFGHFKCNVRRIADYPNLSAYTRDLYQQPGIAKTVNLDHIKVHYYASQLQVNPTGIVPVGPEIDFTAPHGRNSVTGKAA
jgi:putative glutathione S-transferase